MISFRESLKVPLIFHLTKLTEFPTQSLFHFLPTDRAHSITSLHTNWFYFTFCSFQSALLILSIKSHFIQLLFLSLSLRQFLSQLKKLLKLSNRTMMMETTCAHAMIHDLYRAESWSNASEALYTFTWLLWRSSAYDLLSTFSLHASRRKIEKGNWIIFSIGEILGPLGKKKGKIEEVMTTHMLHHHFIWFFWLRQFCHHFPGSS